MSRRRRAEKRFLPSDLRYHNELVARLINFIMRRGKKSVAEHIVYSAFDRIAEKNPDKSPVDVLNLAMENVKPRLEVKSRRVGGATYQIPMEVSADRQVALAMRWMIGFAKSRRGPMCDALAAEILDAAKNTGNAVKKREDTYKMAQANRAFAHYRW